jgi:MscS family membrane protein
MRLAGLLGALACTSLWAQLPGPAGIAVSAAQREAPKDALGRSSPRGTVLGFLAAAHKGSMEVASQYLSTPLRGAAAQRLAKQLFIVLDRRLPARLLELSDSPEGSLSTLKPDEDLIGTISSSQGGVDILVERVAHTKVGSLWLFSRETLDRIPGLYAEINEIQVDAILPSFLLNTQVAGVAIFNWIGVFAGLPAVYYFTVLLNRLLGLLVCVVRRRMWHKATTPPSQILSVPVRLLAISLIIYAMLSRIALPLLSRQIWSTVALLIAIVASIWGAILLSAEIEKRIRQHLVRAGKIETSSVVRLGRRLTELLVIVIGLLAALYLLGFTPTTALAGLGIGGIAIALAAQKTLENILGGVSIIFDKAVGVGDTLRVGDTLGTIEEIGLRSTKVRTSERTVVSIPNGQLANLSLQNLSSRDKFWFHPGVRLRYDTTAGQMRAVLEGVRNLLAHHPRIDPGSINVRFFGFGESSFELEVFAYVMTRDWLEFLRVQEELLLRTMETVEAAGARIALQSPVYVAPTTTAPPLEQLTFPKSTGSNSALDAIR